MPDQRVSKNKVKLSDFNYREDIAHRLLISDLSTLEADVLSEIFNLSIQFSMSQLAKALHTDIKNVEPVIKKFAKSQFLKQVGESIIIDKDLRKYYELQMEKFDNESVPGFEFLFASLRRLPIHVLPEWYALPRATNDILGSIAEQYLSTPKIYERYLSQLTLSNPIAVSIRRDVFASPHLKVRGSELRSRYSLSRETFEETLLELEFHFVCCLSYNLIDGQWEEVVTPFREWRDYVLHCRNVPTVSNIRERDVCTHRNVEFGFVHDLNALLKAATQAALPMDEVDGEQRISLAAAATWLPELRNGLYRDPQDYLKTLYDRLSHLALCAVRKGELHPTPAAKNWLQLAVQDQALTLYRIPVREMLADQEIVILLNDRVLREIERGLRPAMGKGWVALDPFITSLTVSIGNAVPVTLKQTGKSWRYALPNYSEIELKGLRWMLWQRLFEAGMVNTGLYQNSACFCVTSFGEMTLV